MNEEQKQRALQILRRFEQADLMTRQVDGAAVAMATLLQELVDAKEPEPGVPDWLETTQFLTDVTTAAGLLAHGRRDKGLAQRIGDFAFKYQRLAAAPKRDPKLVRDAERYRWLRTYNTAKHPAVTEVFFLGDENLDAEIDAVIAAEKGGA